MPALLLPRLRFRVPIAALCVVLPAVIFYSVLFLRAINLPLDDDYEALLDFLNKLVELKGFAAKTSYFFSSQYNEYKLFFGHAVAWLQLSLFGHVNIRVLCAIGNAFVLLLAILLWKMFLPNHRDLGDRLIFFIPVSWGLLQLEYVETLNWAMPSLQNIPVLLFSFGTIYLLLRAGPLPFYSALVCLMLAVAASGNGFFVIPIGVLILSAGRHYQRIAIWLLISAACIAAYAYRYNVMSSQSRMQASVLSTVLRPRPFYVIAFIGNTASSPLVGHFPRLQIQASLLLGVLLCSFFIALWRRGYVERNPLVCHCVLFLFLTAIGVAGLRSDFGIEQSLASRYAIYSVLFLIFAWYAVVEEFLIPHNRSSVRNGTLLVTIAGVVLFSLVMDRRAWFFLAGRDGRIITGMQAYERPGSNLGPILPFRGQGPRFDELDKHAPEILRQSTRLGIYRPPSY
jgi:hypothetical protein